MRRGRYSVPDAPAQAAVKLRHMADTPILRQIRSLYRDRQLEGWTIPKLAQCSGVAYQSVYKVLKREADCTTVTAYRLLRVLRQPPALPPDRRRKGYRT